MVAATNRQLEVHQHITTILDKIYTAEHYMASYMDQQDTARVKICRAYIDGMHEQITSLKTLLIHL